MLKKITVAVLITAGLAFNAHAVSNNKEYVDFFNKYDALNKAFDPAALDLYADDAKIYSTQIFPDGTENKMTMPISKIKALKNDAMNYAKQVGDIDQYSNIVIHGQGKDTGVKITADRYSLRKCVTDHSFYLIVKKNSQGNLVITESGAESPVESQCKDGMKEDIVLQLAMTVKILSDRLPIKVDGDTLFESVSSQGKELTLNYRIINFKAEELDKHALRDAMWPQIVEDVCRLDQSKRKMLDKGAVLIVKYKSSDGLPIISMTLDLDVCKASS